jgi:UrcA family protein
MQIRSTVLAMAGGLSMASAVPALAGVPTERVPYGDLRLSTAAGQAELQKRLNRAAWKVCLFDENGSLRGSEETAQCYRQARKNVAVQFARIVSEERLGG